MVSKGISFLEGEHFEVSREPRGLEKLRTYPFFLDLDLWGSRRKDDALRKMEDHLLLFRCIARSSGAWRLEPHGAFKAGFWDECQ